METAVVGATIDSADPWVVDRGEVGSQFVGLLDAVSGEGNVGREVSGGGDGVVVGACGGI